MLGKIIGGVIGTVFGPIGTGVGVAIGHAFDSYNKTNDVSDKNSTSGDGFNQTERSKNEQDKYEFKAATIKEYKKH